MHVSPSFVHVGLPFDQRAARPVFSSSFNFFPKIDLPAVSLLVGIHVHVASSLYCPYLFFSGVKLFLGVCNVFYMFQ